MPCLSADCFVGVVQASGGFSFGNLLLISRL
jgi:hypothetical protein